MTSRDFCYWLQGYFEVAHNSGERELTPAQVACIRAHLALVFKHEIDPSMGGPEHQAELNTIHEAIKTVNAKVDAHVKAPTAPHPPHNLVMRC